MVSGVTVTGAAVLMLELLGTRIISPFYGSFGILPRHAAMVSLTESGPLLVRTAAGEELEFLIHDGFAEVRDNRLTILTRSAEKPGEVDLDRAKSAAERARERIRNDRTKIDYIRAESALRRAIARKKYGRRS